MASTFQIFKDDIGEFRWRLRAGNNQIVATSGEGYKVKADCVHGIELVKKEGSTASVEDQSDAEVKA